MGRVGLLADSSLLRSHGGEVGMRLGLQERMRRLVPCC